MVKDMPVDVGLIYEGERIRKKNMYADLAGPKSRGFEVLTVVPEEDVPEDNKVTVVGPDFNEMEEGGKYPLGVKMRVAGKKLEEDLEGVFERRNHDFSNYIQGFMHLNSRDLIWCRVSKDAIKKGLSFNHLGSAVIELFKSEYDVIEKMDITYITDKDIIDDEWKKARKVYDKRDERARGLKDEDVDSFYGCLLCQSFAPTHVCTISPSRTSACGAITWFEGRASSKIDPEGPIFPVPKGELVDPVNGEYSGVNEMTADKSNGTVEKVYLHSMFGYPHTVCGCFETIAFYIPEVDGIGLVHRDFPGVTPFGIPFSTMAGQVGGGVQSEGFLGIGIEYLRSPSFLQADDGWKRIVWAPEDLLKRVEDSIPEEVKDKIPTEKDSEDLEGLKKALEEKEHPVVERWGKEEEGASEGKATAEERATGEGEEPVMNVPEMQMPVQGMPVPGGGNFTITFKNAKIYAEKVIIKRRK